MPPAVERPADNWMVQLPHWFGTTWLAHAPLLALGALACGQQSHEMLPRFGEVMVSIDTDAPVPQLIGRLRIDLFDEDGSWLESRDIARTKAADWPASFSLYTEDETTPRRVLVRARAYLEGRLRDYHGERFEERPSYAEPEVEKTLSDLCDDAPELALGQALTLRRGTRTLTGTIPEQPPADAPSDWTPQCGVATAGGDVAARLEIAQAGDYRIEATRVRPVSLLGGDPILFLRGDCRDPLSQIACVDDSVPYDGVQRFLETDTLPRIVTHLESGSYTLLAGGFFNTPSDVTLRATLAAKWDDQEPTAPTEASADPGLPRLIVDARDVTPPQEPSPLVTIDRLALVTLVPGKKGLVSLTLRVACAGQMAKLSRQASNAPPVIAEAETCVDTEGARVPVTEEAWAALDAAPAPSLVGTFEHGQACAATPKQDTAACMPAGTFVLGSNEGSYWLKEGSLPERFAVMNRFWLDKTEVTVGRWRAALSAGFKSPTASPVENNAPLATASPASFLGQCTFSATPAAALEPREDFPLTCVDWYAARAFCRYEGGDLPTEAQWQYAATKAGRLFETRFPWGDEAPTCARAVVGRDEGGSCQAAGWGKRPVTDSAVMNDSTLLGVRDLGGNVSEWGLDGFAAFDSDCWNAASLVDPMCWEENAPERSVLGGEWSSSLNQTAGWWRTRAPPSGYVFQPDDVYRPAGVGAPGLGFRCAYTDEPR
jgi:formylglycine-generating enzyme required for sulfatase activity